MAGSSFGTLFQITTWGESHGAGIGVVVDGCPAGLSLSSSDIQVFLNRRKPGQTSYSTMRKEADEVEILSGVFEGHTTGVPISMLVRNQDQRSHDYTQIKKLLPPPDTQTTPLTQSMGAGTTGAAAALPAGRRSAGWLEELSLLCF